MSAPEDSGDTWYPPTAENPLVVSLVATPPPAVKSWFPPSAQAPLPVYIVGETGLIGDPPDNQLYGRRGPPDAGVWDLVSLAAGAPEAPTSGPIYGRGQVAGNQVWTPVLPLAGGTMTGALTLAADPAAALQPATKQYVDNVGAVANAAVRRSGDAMTGFLTLAGDPSSALHAATKNYVDNVSTVANAAVKRAGDTMTGLLVLSANPSNALGAVTKQYADAISTVANGALQRAGGTMTGVLTLAADPAAALQPATKQYVDAIGTTASAAVRRAGDTMSGLLVLSADPAAALGAVTKQYADAIMAVAQDGVDIHGDTMTGPLVISANAAALPPPAGGTLLQISGADGTTTRILLDVFGPAVQGNITMRAARGTAAAPSALALNDGIGQFSFFGYGATAYSGSRRASIQGRAAENWTDTAQGTALDFVTTPIGTAAPISMMTAARGLTLGGPVDGDLGLGTLNASAALQINRNTAIPPAAPWPVTCFRIIGADGEGPGLSWEAFAGNSSAIFRRANGTCAAPTHVIPGDNLGAIIWRGYGATGYGGNNTRIAVIALENWTDTAQGSQLQFVTCPIGATSTVISATLGPGLTVGTPPAVSGGALLGDISGQRAIINQNAAALPAFSGTVALEVGLADGVAGGVLIDGFGVTANPTLWFRHSNGTAAAPAALLSGNNLLRITGFGYGATGWSNNRGGVLVQAAENWSDTAQGTLFSVQTTANGSITFATNLTLDGSGNLTILGGTAVKAGGGSWTAPSSLAVKRHVVNYTRGLAELRQLQPISFEYNGAMGTVADGKRYVGLAAEAVAPLLPELLSAGEASVLLDPSALTYALINAVYELDQRLEHLEAHDRGRTN